MPSQHLNITNTEGFGSYTITGSAGLLFSFADAGSPTALPRNAHSFRGRLEVANVRTRGDGTVPTASAGGGERIDAGDDVLLDENLLRVLQFIRIGGTNAVLTGHFYQNYAASFVGG